MKLRFFIYSSLLFVTLALPVVYKTIDYNLQQQEILTRRQKENWLNDAADTEIVLMRLAQALHNHEAFWDHFDKFLEYQLLRCKMIKEDLNQILGSFNS